MRWPRITQRTQNDVVRPIDSDAHRSQAFEIFLHVVAILAISDGPNLFHQLVGVGNRFVGDWGEIGMFDYFVTLLFGHGRQNRLSGCSCVQGNPVADAGISPDCLLTQRSVEIDRLSGFLDDELDAFPGFRCEFFLPAPSRVRIQSVDVGRGDRNEKIRG